MDAFGCVIDSVLMQRATQGPKELVLCIPSITVAGI